MSVLDTLLREDWGSVECGARRDLVRACFPGGDAGAWGCRG